MKSVFRFSVLMLGVGLLLAGCGGKGDNTFQGATYSPTTKVIPVFLPEQVPVSCRVFAQLYVWLPAGSTGKTIARAVEQEARAHGADMLLIGESRQASDDKGVSFAYYGPAREYNCRERWSGWKFGFDVWASQGEWVSLGYKEWGSADVSYDIPIIMQAAFLRCQE
jgi:hypothetical protein